MKSIFKRGLHVLLLSIPASLATYVITQKVSVASVMFVAMVIILTVCKWVVIRRDKINEEIDKDLKLYVELEGMRAQRIVTVGLVCDRLIDKYDQQTAEQYRTKPVTRRLYEN